MLFIVYYYLQLTNIFIAIVLEFSFEFLTYFDLLRIIITKSKIHLIL